ncbi:TAXI family TRAP transporter solute-binding subunit [Halioglobus pacificus]|uniref:TRAP transporter solute receptor, TAXI family n=1 Tax=Parahalioglobus pacificus TaxID=930806 RepID=A0A919CJR0_9GAMM|nr:TAXI family TRAP transporter solute-binding subunit [Halioglobus pacificus]GHD31963.1 hypothetical protein GCM10007053_15570 [Halioglobus pacificus]
MIARRVGQVLRSILLAAFCTITACSVSDNALSVYPIPYQPLDTATLNPLLEQEVGLSLTSTGAGASAPLTALSDGLADITIVENSHPFTAGVRTVLPLYKSVLHILVREDFDIDSLGTGGNELEVLVINRSHAALKFLELSAQRSKWFGQQGQLVEQLEPGKTDMILYLGPINPSKTDWYTEGYQLVSLDQVDDARREFFSEGISYLVPQLEPAHIPALTYNLPGNERGLSTMSVDMLLVASREAPERAIYDLTRTLIEQKARFAALAPNIFSWVTEDFDPLALNFPLHRGARLYLERDEPGFLERYAESINLLVYLAFLCLTGVVALARWQARRKKNRVDTFYTRILTIRERIAFDDPITLRNELEALEREAFELLINERLAADESFRIFTELLSQVRREVDEGKR